MHVQWNSPCEAGCGGPSCDGGRAYVTWPNPHYEPDAPSPFNRVKTGELTGEEADWEWRRDRRHHPEQRCLLWLRDPTVHGLFQFVLLAGSNWGRIDEETWDEVEVFLWHELESCLDLRLTMFFVQRS